MDATVDYLSSSSTSDMYGTEDALSTPKCDWSDPRSPRLSDAVYFSNIAVLSA